MYLDIRSEEDGGELEDRYYFDNGWKIFHDGKSWQCQDNYGNIVRTEEGYELFGGSPASLLTAAINLLRERVVDIHRDDAFHENRDLGGKRKPFYLVDASMGVGIVECKHLEDVMQEARRQVIDGRSVSILLEKPETPNA